MEEFFKAVRDQAVSYDELIDACKSLRMALASLDNGIIRLEETSSPGEEGI
jgi:hypothetical protein